MANTALMAIGAVLLVVGFALVAMSYPTVQNLQTSLGQLGQLFNSSLQQQYQQALMTSYAGGFIGLIGFILLIAGAAVSSGPGQITQYQVASPSNHVAGAPKQFSPEELKEQRVQRRFEAAKNASSSDRCPACGQTMIDQGHLNYCIRDNVLIHKASGIRLNDLPSGDRAYFDQSTWVPNIGDSLLSLTADSLILSNDDGRVQKRIPLEDITELTAQKQSIRVKASDEIYLLDKIAKFGADAIQPEQWVKEIRMTQNYKPRKLPLDTIGRNTRPVRTDEKSPTLTKYCRECGAKIPRNSKFCEECGAKLV